MWITRAHDWPTFTYAALAFAERDVLLASLHEAGYRVEIAPAGKKPPTHCRCSTLHAASSARQLWSFAATSCLPGSATWASPCAEGTYVPMLAAGRRSELLLQDLRAGYGRAKADQLAEAARRKYQGSVRRSVTADGALTIRVRF